MEEETKVELERANLTNYILQKENEILLGTIGILTREKADLLSELDALKKSRTYRITRKIKNIIRRK